MKNAILFIMMQLQLDLLLLSISGVNAQLECTTTINKITISHVKIAHSIVKLVGEINIVILVHQIERKLDSNVSAEMAMVVRIVIILVLKRIIAVACRSLCTLI